MGEAVCKTGSHSKKVSLIELVPVKKVTEFFQIRDKVDSSRILHKRHNAVLHRLYNPLLDLRDNPRVRPVGKRHQRRTSLRPDVLLQHTAAVNDGVLPARHNSGC